MIDASAKQTADLFFKAFSAQLSDEAPTVAGTQQAPLSEQPAPLRSASRPEPAASPLAGEALRVLWFTLGAAATAFGFWVAATLR
jgi:hypothetical protein